MLQIRMTALYRRAAIGVGVALCVAPIFTSAYAQQSGGQTNWALEVQALRQEIAELRDMIERQQFEMRKLKNAQKASQQSGSLSAAPSRPSQAYGVARGGEGVGLGTAPRTGSLPNPAYSSQTGPYSQPDQAYVSAADQSAIGQSTNNQAVGDAGFYNDYQAPNEAQQAQNYESAPYAQTGAPVSESTISVPALNNDGYPPVVDRSVGGPQSENSRVQSARINQPSVGSLDNRYDPSQRVYSANDQPGFSDSSGSVRPQLPASSQSQSLPNSNPNLDRRAVLNTGQPQYRASQNSRGVVAIPSVVANPSVVASGSVAPSAVNSAEAAIGQSTSATAPPKNIVAANKAPQLAEADYYAQAFNLLKQSQHDQAVAMFQQQIETYPQGERADDAFYWIAESMYVNRKLDESKKHFKAIIDNYKQSPRLPDAMLKTAYIEADQGNQIEARILFQEIVQFHPSSNAAISAKNRLADNN